MPSALGLRRDLLRHLEPKRLHSSSPTSLDLHLQAFHDQVAQSFTDLCNLDMLSLPWIHRLLLSFIRAQEEFTLILFDNQSVVHNPPLDRFLQDYLERGVKALDVCNAIRDGIDRIRNWIKLLEIVLCALGNHKLLGEGNFRRAKNPLVDLSISLLDEKDSTAAALAHRNRSFGRQNASHRDHHRYFRSLSWSVSRSWSAARQLQAIGNNLVAPKPNEIVATNGIVAAIFTMSSVLLFVMWVLVAAIPCQDRGLQVHFSIPRHFAWAAPMLSLHDRILEESRKCGRRNACGLLREIHQMDKRVRGMTELADSVQFPLTEEKEGEARQRVEELRLVYEGIKEGLDPLERQVREVFHRIVHSRAEGLDSISRQNHND